MAMKDMGKARAVDEMDECLQPPRYIIDLSLPPVKRYQDLALAFKSRVEALPVLFDEIVQQARLPPHLTHKVAKLCLRRVNSAEETEELRGISQITGIEMYLLVAFNVLLDLFMGCTSGGVKVHHDGGEEHRMLHFRTLDWGMDPLRKVVVHLDFVEKPHGQIIASSITYAGYVGVLTGVKEGLSVSLNFRPCHDTSTWVANFRFYYNHILVLLGFRPSISSLLRQYVLPSTPTSSHRRVCDTSLASVERQLPNTTTTAAYIILCDGETTVIFEKDRANAVVVPSADFVVATNHDIAEEDLPRNAPTVANENSTIMQLTGMEMLVEESIDRKTVICDLWKKTLQKRTSTTSKRSGTPSNCVMERDVVKWMSTYPITNEETHFATIMDPKAGKIIWINRYIRSPVNQEDQERVG
ncbi:MAG: hypothetical protein Q9217_006643 [Psora testacea]